MNAFKFIKSIESDMPARMLLSVHMQISRASVSRLHHLNLTSIRATSSQSAMEPVTLGKTSQTPIVEMKEVRSLLQNGWKLDAENESIIKKFHFKTFTKCLVSSSFILPTRSKALQDFVQIVGIRSKSRNHHPSMGVVSRDFCIRSFLLPDIMSD